MSDIADRLRIGRRWAYTACVVVSAVVAALSYPFWLGGLASFARQARADITVSSARTVRVYWEDPAVDPEACVDIQAVPRVDSYTFALPRSKRHWPEIVFRAESSEGLSIGVVDVDGVALLPTGDRRYLAPWEVWSVNGTAGLFAFAFFGLLASISSMGLRLCLKPEAGPGVQRGFAALLALTASLFWTSVFFPALMSEDSIVQWRQAVTGRYGSWHPPIMAMLMHATRWVTQSPALFTWIQGVLFWGAIVAALFACIRSARLRVVACAVTMLNPVLWTYSAVLWKDVWVAGLLLLAVRPLLRAVRTASGPALWSGTLCIALATCFRPNAASAVIASMAIGSLFVWRSLGFSRKLLRAVLLGLLVLAPAKGMEGLPGVVDQSAEFTAQFALPRYIGVVSRLNRAGPDYAKERDRFDAVFGAGKLDALSKAYDPASGNSVLYIYAGNPPIVPIGQIAAHRGFAFRLSLRAAAAHPVLFLRHEAQVVSNLLQWDRVFAPYHRGIRANEFGLGDQSLIPFAEDRVYGLLAAVDGSVLFRHYVFVAILIGALAYGAKRRYEPWVVLGLLGLGYALGMIVMDTHPDWRYLLPAYLCGWVALFCVPEVLSDNREAPARDSLAVLGHRMCVLVLLLVTLAAVIRYGKISYDAPTYARYDLHAYRAMTDPSLAPEGGIPSPYAFRVLGPAIVRLVPLPDVVAFYLVTCALAVALALLFYAFLCFCGARRVTAAAATLLFVLNKGLFGFSVWNYFQVNDWLALLAIVGSWWMLIRRRWIAFSLMVAAGALARETPLIMIPVALVEAWFGDGRRRHAAAALASAVLPAAVFLAARWWIAPASGAGLIDALREHLFKACSLGSWYRLLVNPFMPFVLVPFVFLKETTAFFRQHRGALPYVALVLASTFFGADYERLMAPAAVVFYWLLAWIGDRALEPRPGLLLAAVAAAALNSSDHFVRGYPWQNEVASTVVSIGLTVALTAGAVVLKRARPPAADEPLSPAMPRAASSARPSAA